MKHGTTEPAERERVVRAIRELERAVREAHGTGKPADVESATREVLTRLGVDEKVYRRQIEGDPDLALLEQAALREATAGAPDPGPYDSISREAPTGQPGDLSATAGENVVNPGDPGPPVLRPPRTPDPLDDPKLPRRT